MRDRYGPLLAYARPYRGGWTLILAGTLLTTAFGLLGPWPLKLLVDSVLGDLPPPDIVAALPGAGTKDGLLVLAAVGVLLIFFVAAALDVVVTYLWIRVGQGMVYDLARDLFARLQRRSLSFHARHSVGDAVARVGGDAWCVHTVADELLFTPGHALLTSVAIVCVMFAMNAQLALVAVVVAPVAVASSLFFGRSIRGAARQRREAEVEIHAHVQQTLSGIHVVQAFGQEERHGVLLQGLVQRALRAQMRATLAGGLNSLGVGLGATAGAGLVLWFGARAVLDGTLSVGSLLVFVAYMGMLQAQLASAAGVFGKLQATRASVDRVHELLQGKPDVVERRGARALGRVEGHVRLEGVRFGYEPGRNVLCHVDLELHPGEVVALVGHSGAGKSTLAGLIPRLYDPDAGRVSVDGRDVREVALAGLRQQVALVLQEPFLFPVSIAENIAYGRPQASRAEVVAAATAANAHRFVEALPEGYDTRLGERGATLSGGERQRLAIARALVKDAPILILDEPTSALDGVTEEELLDALERLMQGRTTLLIAHRQSTIQRADRIATLRDGRISHGAPTAGATA